MGLKEKIFADLKEAMKSGENEKRDSLRLLFNAIKNEEINKMKKDAGLEDGEVIEVISRMIKQRRDSIEQYSGGGRPELAAKEQGEIDILAVYLPEQLSEEAAMKEVEKAIALMDEDKRKNFGLVMQEAMKQLKGKIDGKAVKGIVEKIIQNG